MVMSSCALASGPILSKEQVLSKQPANFFDLKIEDKELIVAVDHNGTKRMPVDRANVWIAKEKGYQSLYSFDSGIGETFEKPITFTIDGFHFLEIPTSPTGSGGFVQKNVFWLAPDDSIHAVDLQSASETYENLAAPGEIILNGGEKEFYVQDDQLKFEFWLAHPGDAHCCPTAGRVTGTYKLVGKPHFDFFERKYVGRMEILVDQFQRESESTAAFLAR
jgi:hypothetical protein